MKARALAARLRDLRELGGVVDMLRDVAAAELHRAERVLATARAYRRMAADGLAIVLAAVEVDAEVDAAPDEGAPGGRRAALPLVAVAYSSALGLAGDFNERMLAEADRVAAEERAAGRRVRVIALGHRAVDHFAGREDVAVLAALPAPTSIDGLGPVMEALAEEIAAALEREPSRVVAIAARFDGPGRLAPEPVPLVPPALPIAGVEARARAARTWFYTAPRALLPRVVEELVFAITYAHLAETLAAEHGARLVATQGASEGLDRDIARVERAYRDARQAAITEEIADVTRAAEALARRGAG